MEIKVFNEENIQRFITDKNHIVISFQDPSYNFVTLPNQKSRIDSIGIHCYDLDQDAEQSPYGRFLFTKAHAKDILDFVNDYKPYIDLICVNCVAGISRSSACAGALSKILNNTDEFYFKNYLPNMLIYRTILEVYNEST